MVYSLNEIEVKDDVERILLLRKRLNMKKSEFSRYVGVSSEHLRRVETYRSPLSPNVKANINKLIRSLGGDIDSYGE